MAKGIEIGVGVDSRAAKRGIETGLIDPLEDADKALVDLGKNKGPDKLEKSLDGAQTATKKLEKETKETAATIEREFRDAYRKTKTASTDSTDAAKRDLQTLSDEAKANASETFSSFDGSAESFGDMLQGTLGGIVADMGPMGMALGAAGAVGVGLIMAAMGDAATATEEVKARTADLATEYITTGNLGAESLEYLVDKLQDLATESDGINLAKLASTAKDSGSSFKDLAQAYAGNTKGLKELWRAGDARIEQLKDEMRAQDLSTEAGKDAFWAIQQQTVAQQKYVGYLGQSIGVAKEAAEAQRNYAEAGGPELELKAAAIESVQGSIDDAAGSWEDYQDAETGAVDPAAYLAGLQERLTAANNYAANLAAAQAQLSPEAYQYLVDQGIDFAPMLSSILSSGLVDQFNTTFTEAATAGNAAIDGTLKKDVAVSVDVTAQTVNPERDLNKLASAKRGAKIDAVASVTTADRDLNKVASAQRTARINAEAVGIDAANRALDKLAKERSITIRATIVDERGRKIT